MKKIALLLLLQFCLFAAAVAADEVLPMGAAPPALDASHFPDRVHAFVWRNWNIVDADKLAAILHTSRENVEKLAESMGLPPAAAVQPEMRSRGYITLIRRNWHLLPYEQLLQLLDMTPEQMAETLREDDFLWIKLGALKPKCEPLRYAPPDEAARRRAAEIKSLVEKEFGGEMRTPGEPRFHFVEKLGKPAADYTPPAPAAAPEEENLSLRYIHSYFAVFGDPLSDPSLDPFPEGLLQRYAAVGINGVWMHVVLRDLAPGNETFPEFGKGHERRLANLRAMVERAKKYGIGIYLYMNEPRAMPAAFFKKPGREKMAGVSDGKYLTLCTSNPEVRKWMQDSLQYIFQQVPDLAGVFTITASENLTNCASHGTWKSCPNCKNRDYAEILADTNDIIAQGVHAGNPNAKVIAWDWGWHGHGDAPDVIAKLPKSVWLMSVSEWAAPFEHQGIKGIVGEYCMSVVGPGPRATRHWQLAKQAGLKTAAKMQLNNTWEFSSVPYMPVMDQVAQHCHNLASAGVNGMMLSWSLGGHPSPNLEIASRFRTQPTPSVDEVLDAVAEKYYGKEGGPLARKAWTAFSTGFREFPYACGLYVTPVQMGPANLLYAKNTEYRATMVGIPYDDLAGWRGSYPAEIFIDQFSKVAAGWQAGIPYLKEAVEKAPPQRRADVEAELRFAQAAAIHFQSVANQSRYVMARNALADASKELSPDEKQAFQAMLAGSLQSEISLSRQLFDLVREDSRIGFESSNQYYYLPQDLVEKAINCRWLMEQLGTASP